MVADMKEWAVTGRPQGNVVYEREGVRRLQVGWWDVRHALALNVSFFLCTENADYLMWKEAEARALV